MSEVDHVVVARERHCEGQCVVAATPTVPFSLERVLIVADVVAHAVPTQLLRSIARVLREAQHSHAFVVKRIRLGQVEDVELNSVVFPSVSDPEEEPLSVTICVDVILQH